MSKAQVYFVMGLLVLAGILNSFYEDVQSATFISALGGTIATAIYIGIFFSWMISIYQRIMEKQIRDYLLAIGFMMLTWMALRWIRWRALEYVIWENRVAWYLYYIPSILIPLLFFFVALHANQKEGYTMNKWWKLLYIPSIFGIFLVLSNDWHQLVFQLDLEQLESGQDRSYGIGYYFVMVYTTFLILGTTLVLLKQKKRMLGKPLIVIFATFLYGICYVVDRSFSQYFMDFTLFSCMAVMAFWEACIQERLLLSNKGHLDFFAKADIGVQILDWEGNGNYASVQAKQVSAIEFQSLVAEKTIEVEENQILHMEIMEEGYLIYSDDISSIRDLMRSLEKVYEELTEDVELLERERIETEHSLRLKEQKKLYAVVWNTIAPQSEAVKQRLDKSRKANGKEKVQLLYEIGILSVYMKRKINLSISAQGAKVVQAFELKRAIEESFQMLQLRTNALFFYLEQDFTLDVYLAISLYDLYQKIVELGEFQVELLLISLDQKEGEVRCTFQLGKKSLSFLDRLIQYEKEQREELRFKVEIEVEEDMYYIKVRGVSCV